MVETSAASALVASSAVACSHAVASFAMDGTVLEANPVFLKTMGYTLAEVQGKHHRLFVTSEYAASREYGMFWEQFNGGEFQAAEIKRVGKGGKEVWLLATYSPILDASGKPYKVIKFATDLTEQKRRYTAVEREKSVYLANMSHEIRTPLNGIFGMLSLLRDTALDMSGRTYVDTCMRSAESLLAVLNDILFYSKADAGAVVLEHAPYANINTLFLGDSTRKRWIVLLVYVTYSS
jgi:two-component system, sensor histidine kinase and response regulator